MNLQTYLEKLSATSYAPSDFIKYLRGTSPLDFTSRSSTTKLSHLHFFNEGSTTLSIEEQMFGRTNEKTSYRYYTYYVIIKILAFSIRDLLRRIDDDVSNAPTSQYPALFIKLHSLIKMVTAFFLMDFIMQLAEKQILIDVIYFLMIVLKQAIGNFLQKIKKHYLYTK
jgi:hypothetical protein